MVRAGYLDPRHVRLGRWAGNARCETGTQIPGLKIWSLGLCLPTWTSLVTTAEVSAISVWPRTPELVPFIVEFGDDHGPFAGFVGSCAAH